MISLSKNKLILAAVVIAAAIGTWFLFTQGGPGPEQTPTPKTPEEIQEELQRLEEEKKRLEEDVKKVEEGEVACILVYDPACGADGKTYSNSCFAGVAGVEIAHQGECRQTPKPSPALPILSPRPRQGEAEGGSTPSEQQNRDLTL